MAPAAGEGYRPGEIQLTLPSPKPSEGKPTKPAGGLRPRGTPTARTEAAMERAASPFGLTADQLRIVIDRHADWFPKAARAVSDLMHGQGMSFEEAMAEMERLKRIEGT